MDLYHCFKGTKKKSARTLMNVLRMPALPKGPQETNWRVAQQILTGLVDIGWLHATKVGRQLSQYKGERAYHLRGRFHSELYDDSDSDDEEEYREVPSLEQLFDEAEEVPHSEALEEERRAMKKRQAENLRRRRAEASSDDDDEVPKKKQRKHKSLDNFIASSDDDDDDRPRKRR